MTGNRWKREPGTSVSKKFPDLSQLPPELSLLILSKLNATDLYLASCVWHDLASDEILWQGYIILTIVLQINKRKTVLDIKDRQRCLH